jgi:hypothetical protein
MWIYASTSSASIEKEDSQKKLRNEQNERKERHHFESVCFCIGLDSQPPLLHGPGGLSSDPLFYHKVRFRRREQMV